MPPTPSQIKELLLSAIDKDENIVDMGCVTKAVTLLESNPITKDALEETRLGRLVKIVRKKATNSNLKKRCTALIKQWQSQFLPPSAVKPPRTESPAPTSSGQDEVKGQEESSTSDGQKAKPAKQTPNATPVDKSKSENLRRRKRENESSPSISPSTQSPPTKKLLSSRGKSPLVPEEGNGQDDSSLNGVSLKRDGDRRVTAIKDSLRVASPKTSSVSPKNKLSISKEKGSSKKLKKDGSPSPKTRTKEPSANSVSTSLQCKVNKPEDNLSPSISRSKSEKRLKISPRLGNVTIGKKRTTSLERSPMPRNDSSASNSPAARGVVPPAQPPTVITTDWDMAGVNYGGSGESSRSGTPHEAFDGPSSLKSLSIFDLDFREAMHPEPSMEGFVDSMASPIDRDDTPPRAPESLSLFSLDEPFSDGLPVEMDSPQASPEPDEEEEEERERSLQKMETLEDEEPPTPPSPVLESDIERIHTEEWPGVNGCYNDRGEWFDWSQCLTVQTDLENSLQILPYVCID